MYIKSNEVTMDRTKKILTSSNKFRKHMHFPYQERLLLLPRASDWPSVDMV